MTLTKERRKQKHCIYAITNVISGKRYVGLTRLPKKRKRKHFSTLRRGVHHSTMLQAAYDKYGRDVFVFEIIERGLAESEANNREIYWIAYFDSFNNGYNMTPGGEHEYTIPHNAKTTVWNEVEYPSIQHAADAIGITWHAMRNRIKRGYVCDGDMLGTGNSSSIPCVWNGVEYSSITDAANALNITSSSMRERLANGYTCDDDMKGMGNRFAGLAKSCTWNNVEYSSISEAAKANNVSFGCMQARLSKGYTCDKDMIGKRGGYEHPLSIAVTWNGIEYESIHSAARALNITAATMSYRVQQGYTCDEDLTAHGMQNANEITWNGITYPSQAAAARANGIHPVTMGKRLSQGYTCDSDLQNGGKS